MMRVWPLLTLIVLFGCSKPAEFGAGGSAGAAAPLPSAKTGAPTAADAVAQDADPSADASKAPVPAAAVPLLAYSYAFGVEVPASRIPTLVAAHEAACAAAGVAVCQVTASTSQAQGKDSAGATLTLRAAPAWATGFKADIAAQAKSVGGDVYSATVTSEDLSREIVDTEATVRAKTALRDRLQAVLETRQGKISDLLDVETALSTAQGELDTLQSELAAARERVATSLITIEYRSTGLLAPQGVWAPLGGAINGFVGMVVGGLAIMVWLVAAILPWAIVGGALAWLFRRRLPWRPNRHVGRDPPGPPKP